MLKGQIGYCDADRVGCGNSERCFRLVEKLLKLDFRLLSTSPSPIQGGICMQ